MSERALLTLADRLTEIEDSLERAGFRSCLSDRDWMRARSSDQEWHDHILYSREYAREVVLSSAPSSIKLSNPGEYQWHSALIASRVSDRFRKFGDVHACFLESSKRHLVELTAPAQRLSKMLERASPSDIEEWERRHLEFEQRYGVELKREETSPIVQQILKDPTASADIARRSFVRMVFARVRHDISTVNAISIRLAASTDSSSDYLEFEPEVIPEQLSSSARGALYVTTSYRSALQAGLPQRRRVAVERILPGEFREYSRFSSPAEFALGFAAWLHVTAYMVKVLLDQDWRLVSGS
jgi:hypothetical protein